MQNLPLTSKVKFRFGLACPGLARQKRNFTFEVNGRFCTRRRVTLYIWWIYVQGDLFLDPKSVTETGVIVSGEACSVQPDGTPDIFKLAEINKNISESKPCIVVKKPFLYENIAKKYVVLSLVHLERAIKNTVMNELAARVNDVAYDKWNSLP